MPMILGDKDSDSAEEITCKFPVGTNLVTENHGLFKRSAETVFCFSRQPQKLGYLLCHCVPERAAFNFIYR